MRKITSVLLIVATTFALTACSTQTTSVVEFEPIEIITELEETLPEDQQIPMMELDDALLQELYGIDDTLVDSYVARVPMMNVQSEEYFIAKVKEGKMEEVTEKIKARQADLVEQWQQYLPDQLAFVEAYQLSEKDGYVAFAIGNNADTVIELFEAKFEQE